LKRRFYEIAGLKFNIASPKQLGTILFDQMKLVEKAKKDKDRTVCHRRRKYWLIWPTIIPSRQKFWSFVNCKKLKSTYVDALPTLISPKDGRIHTSYNQAVAATGRLSSTNPNLQNIPIRTKKGREIRKAFVPRGQEFTLMAADYSQIELRILAAFSGDENMIKAFVEGKDIHAATAAKVFDIPIEEVTSEHRGKAKSVNFGHQLWPDGIWFGAKSGYLQNRSSGDHQFLL
jgi:DNA polymerase-1